jgi:hypothetical protein
MVSKIFISEDPWTQTKVFLTWLELSLHDGGGVVDGGGAGGSCATTGFPPAESFRAPE